MSREVVEIVTQMAANLGTALFDSKIRETIAVKEAQLLQQGLFEYAPKCNAAADYQAFIDELLKE